ncbi:MAG: hypothetical protein IPO01_18260 [Chitinophagaceae bacterium]|nr:hypothetical protein [Chitinophagaceae bacterium]
MNKQKLTVADLKTVFGGDPQSADTGTPPPPPPPPQKCYWFSLVKSASV